MSAQPAFAASPASATSHSPGASASTDGTGTAQSPAADTGYPLQPTESRDSVYSVMSGVSSVTDTQSRFPTPKTDKPRPHVCTTCGRSFARLEHLKRHERSHTKEKPFECPECTRCFARRDLLLRHQQKLHMTTTPSARHRNSRRESTSSVSNNVGAKVRKGSVASTLSFGGPTGAGTMRPRANTIGHVDGASLGFLAPSASPSGHVPMPIQMHQHTFGDFGNDSSAAALMHHHHHQQQQQQQHNLHQNGLPRLTTTDGRMIDPSEPTLHTAPPMQNYSFDQAFADGTDYSGLFPSSASTVNPAQLQVGDAQASPISPMSQSHFGQLSPDTILEDGGPVMDWSRGFPGFLNLGPTQDHLNGPMSPPILSPDVHSAMTEPSYELCGRLFPPGSFTWNQQSFVHQNAHHGSAFGLDPMASISEFGFVSPDDGQMSADHKQASWDPSVSVEGLYPTPPHQPSSASPAAPPNSHLLNHFLHHQQQPASSISDGSMSMSSSSIAGSGPQSSTTSVATDSITESVRQTLLASLTQTHALGLGARKFSQPNVSSPLSAIKDGARPGASGFSLPSAADLQRYVSAYIQYFHPHFPFLHIPTLSFDSPAYTTSLGVSSGPSHGGTLGGGGCLILAMAAIGALYEYERPASKELFEAAKKMIQLYLAERRKADHSSASSTGRSPAELAAQNTPVWLVQAMLLNVIYGHNCGDKTSGDIASTHCTALVSLARAAELTRPARDLPTDLPQGGAKRTFPPAADVQMSDEFDFHSPWSTGILAADEDVQWRRWAAAEERKRTLFAIFHMSSLLVSGYNHAPALTNSEIQLDLPCDEDLWHAETAQVWNEKGGSRFAEQNALSFSGALSTLLSASHVQNKSNSMATQSFPAFANIPDQEMHVNLRPSTFGCLVLINALHNYIWETRQRHSGHRWTTQETEAMHAHIEPALRAWQAAWASNPAHSLERPNPFGLGPLSADSIPLLDLAYVRLFVNLGSSKEAFWQRDFERMSEELASGSEIIQHAEHSDAPTGQNSANQSRNSPEPFYGAGGFRIPRTPEQADQVHIHQGSSKRERHLRKAAFYAADSLSMSEKLGVTFADFTSRELPVQSALCAFDCAQVLAEWVATVQERVGPYLGILGRDPIDSLQAPATALLEEEDSKLLDKISDILKKAESKMSSDIHNMGQNMASSAIDRLPSMNGNGFGSKILLVTAYMLDRAAVWPVTSLMCRGLSIQANHMSKRANASVYNRTHALS